MRVVKGRVVEYFRVTPVSSWALLLGLVFRDVLMVLVQMGLMILMALLLGAQINAGGVGFALVLLMMLGICLSSAACALPLALKDANSFAALITPVLQTVGLFNPFAYDVSAARHLFLGNLADVSVAQGFALMGGLMVLALLWGVRAFKRATV